MGKFITNSIIHRTPGSNIPKACPRAIQRLPSPCFAAGGPASANSTSKLQNDFPALPLSNTHPSGPAPRGSGTDSNTKWGRHKGPPRCSAPPSLPSSSSSSTPKPEDFPSLAAAGLAQGVAAQKQDNCSRPSNSTPGAVGTMAKVSEGLKAMNKVRSKSGIRSICSCQPLFGTVQRVFFVAMQMTVAHWKSILSPFLLQTCSGW